MQSLHITNDAILYDKLVITPMFVLVGISSIMTGANLGMGCSIIQYCTVAHYSIVDTKRH
jgi:UDP-N-acetylglucosamine acyltransferase